MKRLVLAALLVSSPALAVKLTVRPPPSNQPAIAADGNARLVSAIRGHDPKAIAALLERPLAHGALWFSDAACTKRFGQPATLTTEADVQAFARCLATLQLDTTTRQSTHPLDVVLTYKPGVEVELRFTLAGKVASFGGDWALASATPMLTAQAFEALRKTGTTNLDAAIGSKLDYVVTNGSPATWLRVCLDAKGNVTSAHAAEPAPVGEIFEAAVADWSFRPFIHRGTAIGICSSSLLSYPAASAPSVEVLPPLAPPPGGAAKVEIKDKVREYEFEDDEIGGPPPAAPPNVPASVLETLRITGNKIIAPDPVTLQAITSAKRRVVGSFKLCIGTTGRVTSTQLLKTTGFTAYDRKLEREMRTWSYRPYLVNRVASPVCTAMTFVYAP